MDVVLMKKIHSYNNERKRRNKKGKRETKNLSSMGMPF